LCLLVVVVCCLLSVSVITAHTNTPKCIHANMRARSPAIAHILSRLHTHIAFTRTSLYTYATQTHERAHRQAHTPRSHFYSHTRTHTCSPALSPLGVARTESGPEDPTAHLEPGERNADTGNLWTPPWMASHTSHSPHADYWGRSRGHTAVISFRSSVSSNRRRVSGATASPMTVTRHHFGGVTPQRRKPLDKIPNATEPREAMCPNDGVYYWATYSPLVAWYFLYTPRSVRVVGELVWG
jgi:hypothetical protein